MTGRIVQKFLKFLSRRRPPFWVRYGSVVVLIGAVTVSGLPQREDHNVVVAAFAEIAGIDIADVLLADEDYSPLS